MIIKQTEQKEVEVITSILCDSCGEECIKSLGAEYMSLKVDWGFTSDHDLETWTAQICEKCVDDKFTFINFKKSKTLLQYEKRTPTINRRNRKK